MSTAAFITLGCKVNQYETQRILDDFEARGFAIAPSNAAADVYVINSCSVTQAAERKSRYMARKVARQNSDAIVVLTGCYGEMASIKGETVEDVHLIVPNHRKMETLDHVLRAFPGLTPDLDAARTRSVPTAPRRRHRATLKVQDGCDVYCTFCSIPYTRKVMSSRPLDELVAETEVRVRQGYQEIVVTGVLVGAYGQESPDERNLRRERHGPDEWDLEMHQDTSMQIPERVSTSGGFWAPGRKYARPDLADLLLRLARVPGIERVRLSSIEPTQITDRLLDAFAAEPRLCRHLHVPLQSGDSDILRAMNRPYDQAFYLERCRAAYARIVDLAITSDIMVGFPGEDRRAFENTLQVVDTVGFARAHLFRYSPRPNTPAADFKYQVPEPEKEARSAELSVACKDSRQRFIQRYLGRTMEVLIEGREGAIACDSDDGPSGNDGHVSICPASATIATGLLAGYTSNYIRVQCVGSPGLIGTMVRAQLLEPTAEGAIGNIGDAHVGPEEAPPDAEFIPLTPFGGRLV